MAMLNTGAATISEYIAAFSGETRQRLQKIRETIQKAAPGAGEKISYAIPTFTLEGNLVHFAGYKNHIGFYPGAGGIEAFKVELKGFETSKGTVQFPHDKPLPLKLVTQIVKFRVQQNKEKAGSKKGGKAKASPQKTKPGDTDAVTEWMSKLSAPVKAEVEAVRKMIRSASPKLQERIKWNAPSYYYNDDILTFGPYKNDKILLVVHHPFVEQIKSPILEGNYKGRRLINFKDKKEAEKSKVELTRIIKAIISQIEKSKP